MGRIKRARVVATGFALVWVASGCTPAPPTPLPPPTWSFELVSANGSGTGSGNAASGTRPIPTLPARPLVASADGSTVAFHSFATDLGPDDQGSATDSDIYARDVETGVTSLVTVSAPGKDPENGGDITKMAVSDDGTSVAFVSTADNLVPADTNGVADVFVRDLVAGTTTLVSANAAGTDSANAASDDFAFSPDGTKVVFTSAATDLGPATRGDTTRTDVYIRDLTTGQVILASAGSDGLDGVAPSWQPVFSPQGDAVAFTSAERFATDPDTDTDIFRYDLETGVTTLVSAVTPAPEGSQAGFGADAEAPVFRPDGGAVAYEVSVYYQIDSQAHYYHDIVLADLASGTAELVSDHPVPTHWSISLDKIARTPVFSPDGTRIMFESNAAYFGPTDTNNLGDVYMRDLTTGTTTLVTVASGGTAAAGGVRPSLSADGSMVTFASWTGAYGPEDDPDGDNVDHLYVRDLSANRTTLVASDMAIPGEYWDQIEPVFIGDGLRIAFVSESSDLGPTDSNGVADVYLATGTRPAAAG